MATATDSDATTSSTFSLVGELEEGELSSGLEDEGFEEGEIKDDHHEELETSSSSILRISFEEPTRPIPIVVSCNDTGYTITNGTKYLSHDGIDEFWLDHLRFNIISFIATRKPFSTTIYATDPKTRLRIQKCWKRRPYNILIHTVENGRLPPLSSSCRECKYLDCHRLKADRILKRISV